MKKLILPLLAAGLMSSAYGMQPPVKTSPAPASSQPATTASTTTSIPGSKTASSTSSGGLTTFYVVGGIAFGTAIAIAAGNHGKSTTGTTGTR